MQDLRNAIVSQVGGGSLTAVSVTLGAQYPSRLVAVNPGPPSGSLRTVGSTTRLVNVTVRNATVSGETGDYWNVSTQAGNGRVYRTGGIAYDPSYNVYTNPPRTVYDHTVLYNDFRDAQVTLANQSFVDGTQLSLVTLNGSFDRAKAGSTSVDIRPVSSSTREVEIASPDSDSPITLMLVSQRPPVRWEFLENTQSNVIAVEDAPTPAPSGFHTVLVKLDPGETYQLQMTKVGVGTRVTDEPATYLTDVEGDGRTISRGETTELVLEVRDAYNNPVSNIDIEGAVEGSNTGSLTRTSRSSDGDGRVEFVYKAAQSTTTGTHTVQFSLAGVDNTFDGSTPENVSVSVTVTKAGQGPGPGPGNSALVYNDDATAVDSSETSDGIESGLEFTVTNEVGEAVDITTVAIDPVNDNIDVISDTVSNFLAPAPQRNELYIEADTDGYTDYGGGTGIPRAVDVDSDGNLNGPNPILFDTSTSTFHLFEFERFGTRTDMNGESVTITVTYEKASGGTDSDIFTVAPDGNPTQEPSAEFSITSDGSTSNGKWDFDATASSDPQGDSLRYEWDLDGDGIFDDATGQTLQGERVMSGTTVSLRVVDTSGNADTARNVVP